MNNKPEQSNCFISAPAALVTSEKVKYMLSQDVNIIGRCENAFICLKDHLISRIHCIISRTEDNKFTICDKSMSGTYVNDKRLGKSRIHNLQHKDKISLSGLDKYVYVFYLNSKFDSIVLQSAELKSKMQEKILDLDKSHSMELDKLNHELSKIESEKSELKEEMNVKLESQETIFKKECENLSILDTHTSEQQKKAESKLKELKQKFAAVKKKLMEEVESKIVIMNKGEEKLQQMKIDIEMQHQKDKKELVKKFQAELMDLKLKLEVSEIIQDRLQKETTEAKQQLAESKQILLDCEIEQTRLVNEKVEVETKLASTIIDLTNEKDNVVRDLKRKLKETEKEQERVRKEIEGLEEHLMCSICTELFIEPTVLNCGHMFCKTCINEWKTKKKICPMCRTKISGCVQVFNLDSIIEKNVAMLSTEAKEHRDNVIKNRKNSTPKSATKKKRKNSRLITTVNYYRHNPTPNPIPMVQIPNYHHFIRLGARVTDQDDLIDPFGWRPPAERVPSPTPAPEGTGSLEDAVPMAAIDLTNVIETPVHRTRSATATSASTSGLIDLTVTP